MLLTVSPLFSRQAGERTCKVVEMVETNSVTEKDIRFAEKNVLYDVPHNELVSQGALLSAH